MAKHRRVASSSPEPEEQTPDRQQTRTGRGAPRKAKEKAEGAWHALVPAQRKAKSDKDQAKTDRNQAKTDRKQAKTATKDTSSDKTTSLSGRARKLNAERYAAPEIDVDTSEDEADGGVLAPTSKKPSPSRSAAKSAAPQTSESGKSSKKNDQVAGSDSESRSEEDEGADEREADNEEDGEESSEESGLEALEGKPGALQALLDKEEVTWVDEESRERDDDRASRHSVTASAKARKSASLGRVAVLLGAKSQSVTRWKRDRLGAFNLDDSRPPSPTAHLSKDAEAGKPGKSKKRQQKDLSSDDDNEKHTPRPPSKKVKASCVNSSRKKPTDETSPSKPTRSTPDSKDKKAVRKIDNKATASETKGDRRKQFGVTKGDKKDTANTPGGLKRKRLKADETIKWKDGSDMDESADSRRPAKRHGKSKLDSESESSSESSESSDSDSDSDTDHDKDGIDLVLPRRGGKRMKLKKQHPRVKEVAKLSINYILRDICVVNAFPDGPEKSSEFARRALRQAAKDRGEEEMARRLKQDKTYWKRLASIPNQRIPNFRGKVKKATDSVPGNVFSVQQGDVDHVQWLQEGLRYMYPHDYAAKTITSTAPYESPVFANVLRTVFFAKPRSYGYSLVKHFESSDLENPDQKEIPAAMLALVSTAIYASLEDYRKSRYSVGDFKADLFLDAYKHNITELSNLKNAKPRKYHKLMHGLYLKACSGSSLTTHKPAVSFLNLKDMPDE